jgi:hypothetical protein
VTTAAQRAEDWQRSRFEIERLPSNGVHTRTETSVSGLMSSVDIYDHDTLACTTASSQPFWFVSRITYNSLTCAQSICGRVFTRAERRRGTAILDVGSQQLVSSLSSLWRARWRLIPRCERHAELIELAQRAPASLQHQAAAGLDGLALLLADSDSHRYPHQRCRSTVICRQRMTGRSRPSARPPPQQPLQQLRLLPPRQFLPLRQPRPLLRPSVQPSPLHLVHSPPRVHSPQA